MFSWFVTPVYAQIPGGSARRICDLEDIITGIFDKIWPFVGIALLFMFISGGAMWMMSAGDPQKIAKSTSTLLWAFVGACILALLMVIMGTFETILGLPTGTFSVFNIPGC